MRAPRITSLAQAAQLSDAQRELRERKRKANAERSEQEARQFCVMAERYGIGIPEREYEFRAGRGSAFDFAWSEFKVALEVEGGIFARQGHGSMVRIAIDMEKYNAAAAHGWLVLRCVPGQKDVTRWRTSTKTGLRTPTPIYSVPGLCTFTNLKNILSAIEMRR